MERLNNSVKYGATQSVIRLKTANLILLSRFSPKAFLLSMAVRKFMKPKSALAFSRRLAFNSRNGKPCLQTRIMNLRGNLISDVVVRTLRNQDRGGVDRKESLVISSMSYAF